MAFTVRYVPLSPRMHDPAPQTKTSDVGSFQFVPLTQDIINKARKHFEDLVRDLSYTPVPTPFDQMGFPIFASTSTVPFDDMQVSAPITNPNYGEQQEYLSFLEQNNQPEPTLFSSADDPPEVDVDMDTAMAEMANLEASMAWNLTHDQLLEMESWDISSDAQLTAESSSDLEALLAATDPSNLEAIRTHLEEFEREFYGDSAPTPSSSNE